MGNLFEGQNEKAENTNAVHWLAKPRVTTAVVLFLFIVFSAIALFLGHQHLNTARANSLLSDKIYSNLLSTLLLEHERATINILRSYASRSAFIEAVKHKNVANAEQQLSELKMSHEIDLTFVSDPRGVLWINYPYFPEAIGKDLSYRDWFKGVSAHWKPYVSEVFKLIVADLPLAVAISVPVIDSRGKVVGILSNSQRLEFLDNIIEKVPFDPYTTVTIIDRKGLMLYSNRYSFREKITRYPNLPIVERVAGEDRFRFETVDDGDGGKMYLSTFPVGDIGWRVIIERKEHDVYRAELRGLVEIGTAALLLFVITSGGFAYARRYALYRRTEELLASQRDVAERERRYRSLLESVEMIAVGLDTEGRISFVNPYFLKITGYPSDEVLGKEWFGMFLTNEEREEVREVFNRLKRERQSSDYENKILTKTGMERIIAWNNTILLDSRGDIIGTMSLGADVTESRQTEELLRESERRYRELFENALEGIFETSAEGRFLAANPAMAKIYGYDSTKELIEQTTNVARELYVNPQDREAVIRIIASEGVLKNYELQHRRRDGSIVWLLTNARAIRDESGNLLMLEGMVVDITERKLAEAEIHRLNDELEQRVRNRTTQLEAANRELEAFAYSVSHDLRAPLRSIDGFSQALIEDCQDNIDETGKDYLGRIRKAAQRMGFLIDDILKLSRVARYELHRESVDLSRIFREVVDDYKKAHSGRDMEIVVQDGIMVLGDPYLLKIVLENLIDNACKFTSKRPRAKIEFGTLSKNGETVFFIRDNGVGFDMTYVGKLFGAFQRLHKTEDFPGTGIGLATVQRIIHRHQGRIWTEGEVDRGATFYFTLPT